MPAPDAQAYASSGYDAPVGEIETGLAAIWAQVLKLEKVGRHDNFFELGGHSLLVVSVIERMRRAGLHVDIRTFFASPTVAALAMEAGTESGEVDVPANRIPPGCEKITPDMLSLAALTPEEIEGVVATVPGGAGNVQDIYGLAPLQEGILFHHMLAREGDPYQAQMLFSFDSRERLDDYVRALQAVVDRHDVLRTAVLWEGLSEPVQVVWRQARLVVEEADFDATAGDVAQQLSARFDSRHFRFDLGQAPLLRLFIAHDAANGRWLMLQLHHHLAVDHASSAVLHEEILAHLQGRGGELPAPVAYRNFLAQARLGTSREEHEAFFKDMLGDVDEPTTPFGLTDVRGDGSDVAETRQRLDASLARRLRERARALGVTTASLFHLAWAQVVARASGRDDVVFGTVLLGRMQAGEGGDRAPGLFMNTLPIRIRVDEESVQEAVWRTHMQLAQLLGHEHAPLAEAQRCSALPAPTPLFSALLNCRRINEDGGLPFKGSKATQSWPGIEILGARGRTNYPLLMSVDDFVEGFALHAQVQSPVDPQRVCAYMQTALEQLVDALENAPATPLASLEVMPAAERQQLLVEWNDTAADYPREQSVHQLFEAQAARTPEAIAVVWEGGELGYGELNARANRLAHHLMALGVGPETLVGVCMERSPMLIVGLLGILKAGGAYVPLDPNYPPARLAFMLADTQAPVLLTQEALVGQLSSYEGRILCLDRDWDAIAGEPDSNPPCRTAAENLAYVIFTSGSTGEPKGVSITHASLCNLVYWHQQAYGVTPTDRATQIAAPAFDASVWELWPYLTAGASVHIPDEVTRLGPEKLVGWLIGQRITLSFLPTPLAEAALREHWPADCAMRVLLTGGDLLRQRPGKDLPFRLVNHYGPTENTVVSTCAEVQASEVVRTAPPIGRPIANTRAYILDSHLHPAPVGVPGELFVGGEQLARGYLNRPELTAEKFVADPFSGVAGARLYRTGDLVRYLPDGNIEYLGRLDDQVKIRGFRIEPGEVEAVLASHPAVRHVVVQAREDTPGDKRLVAYVVPADPAFGDTEPLRALARQRLPDYMRPAAYVLLERLPLTANGKIDHKALPAPDGQAYASHYEEPVGEIETGLAAIWAQVLKLEKVGRHDNFFELGGHSLLVVSVIERMRRAGLHVDIRTFFASPTVAALAMEAGTESGEVDVPANRIPPGCEKITPDMLSLAALTPEEIEGVVATVPGGAGNVQDIYGLAPLQEGILFHHMLAREGDPYQAQMLFSFDSRERLDDYVRALQAVVDRHDVLRTAVLWEGLSEPVQVVWRQARLVVEEADFDATAGDVAQQLSARFDSRHFRFDLGQAPLLRLFIAHDAANGRWLMLQLFHHLAVDHTALEVLHEEILAHLQGRGGELPAPVAYRNFLAQARLGTSREEHEAFFKDMLGDVDEPTTPFGLTDVRGDGSDVAETRQRLDASLARRLRERARALGVTTASLFHLAWAQVVARASGRDDVVFGTVLLGRMQAGEGGDRAPGLFMNTLPIRIRVDEESVQEAVWRTHMQLAQLLGHEHAPLAVAQRCSALPAPTPLFSALLNCRRINESGRLPFKGSKAAQSWPGIEFLRVEERTNYPLVMSVSDFSEGIALDVQVRSPIDPHRVCAYMNTALEQLVDALERAPATPLASLDVMPAAERHQLLVEWNDTSADYPRDQSIHQLFEAQAARTPEAIAVVWEGGELSYGELNARANRLAHHLMALGVGPETLVGVCLERSPALIVALLGILKAGGAYVPLDPNYPPARLAFMLADTQAPVLLTEEVLLGQLPSYEGHVLCLDRDRDAIAGGPDSDPPCRTTAENAAYVIYTSGSTGEPKGVVLTHANATAFLAWANRTFDRASMERTLFSTSICFDLSIFELFAPLVSGCTVLLVRDALELSQAPSALAPSLLNTVPSAALALLEAQALPTGLRTICLAGEPLRAELVAGLRDAAPKARIYNLYGPTECTTYATCCEVDRGARITIGRPVSNTEVYILDAQLRPAPIGVSGEIYLAGAGLTRGYLNRPGLTAEKFVADPFSTVAGMRMYRTGDLARYRPDGNIEFLGRLDDQVKIRGFRIEPGEIEAVLGDHPAVRQAVVQAREDTPGDKRLIAYVVPVDPAFGDTEPLSALLRERLPHFMRPAAFVVLDALPLTANGKIDRKALPAPDGRAYAGHYEAPVGEIETTLAEIWAAVLQLDKVGRHDSFFELGGHSLVAVQAISLMQERTGVALPLLMLYKSPTVATLAERFAIGAQPLVDDGAGPADTGRLTAQPPTDVSEDTGLAPIDRIYSDQHAIVQAWRGQRVTPKSLIVTRNGSGRRQGLFWCLQAGHELSKLAKNLGSDQPVHGMRSGHLIMEYSGENIEAITQLYTAEMIALQPDGPFLVGGNCQGSGIAYAIALRLRELGRAVSLLILMEESRFRFYDGPVALIFGRDSVVNPYRPTADPKAMKEAGVPQRLKLAANPDAVFTSTFPAGYTVDIIEGTHGKFFSSPNIESLAATLTRLLFDASDRRWMQTHLNKMMASPYNRLLPWRPRNPLDPAATWSDILGVLKRLRFDVPPPDDFDEAEYLSANADVAEACRKGRLKSGYQHYIMYGRGENRQRPERSGQSVRRPDRII